ncbi:Pentatricopeptide repeat-containing protein [Rhynchospora pubera]|uniref:Pentatricopeptide repeat-containing protein n=1 Tax=Rhynchospora pubera TaxID=906938 RepID=A0AAV8CG13_9POAL|nr:Pentatricopeptide repeat-containing protein [Rhynchospora pubera]
MQHLIASKPNQSVRVNSYLDSDKLCAFPFVKARRMQRFGFPTNFPMLKSDEINKSGASHTSTSRYSNRALGVDQTSEKVDSNYEKSSKSPRNGWVNMDALTLTLRNAKTAEDVAELLKDYSDLPLSLFTSLIQGLGRAKRLEAAFAIVEWLKKNKTLNVLIYNSLLCAVKLNKEYCKVSDVIEDMKSQGLELCIITYNTLMTIYIEQKKPKEVFNLLSQIQDAGLSPSPATFHITLMAYKEMEDAHGALQHFIEFREKYQMGELQRDSPEEDWDNEFVEIEKTTVRICLSLVHRLVVKKENNTTEVLKFLNYMDRAGVTIDKNLFKQLVRAYTREEPYMVVRELYERLRESGPGDGLTVTVCNHIIWLMGKAKKWWAALKVYEEMVEKGPTPNNLSFELFVSNFTVLLTDTKRRVLWRWAVQLLDKMHERGLMSGTRQWDAVVIACSKAGQTHASIKIFQHMVQKGEKPTVYSYVALLSALKKGTLYDEAIRVWDHMQKLGVEQNLHTYTILASIYAQKGDHDKIELVLEEMVAARIEPTVVTFNTIISSCAKRQMGAAAFEWFHRMRGRNVKPDEISYEMLIDALTHDGKPKLAYQMYVRAYNEGLKLNKKAYDAVVEAGRASGVVVDLDDLGFHPVERRKPTQINNNPPV